MNPLISFIIPYYNAGNTIQETIDSIFKQSYENFDIWLVNDGSTDQFSIDKLIDFSSTEKIHVVHQENAGPSIARNRAIAMSKAEFVLPLDADNLISIDAIVSALPYLIEDKSLSAVYGNFKFFGEKAEIKKLENYDKKKSFIYSQVDTCALIRKSIFEENINYDESLSKIGLEDWEFWMNFHFKNLKSLYLDFVFFHLRISYGSRTYQVANKNLSEIKEIIVKKHHEFLLDEYTQLYYEKKMLLETPDYKIGNFVLKPYRFFKKKFKN
jgi:glycosyltransferase involved in cell wall biosynthesis